MDVDQKHITTIRMHDAKGCEICLTKDGHDYQLQLSSSHHQVNITLGVQEVRQLCQQLVRMDMEENWRAPAYVPPEFKSFFFNGGPRPYPDAMASWFARVAGDHCETAGKR
jgi:hypothetical protein